MLTVLIVFLCLVLAYLVLSYFLFRLVCRRFKPGHDPLAGITLGSDKHLSEYPELIDAGKAWLQSHTPRDVYLTSYDGLRLHGSLYETPGARAVLVGCHGYRSTGAHDFLAGLPFYASRGFNILLVDQRACGQSEGVYVTLGIRERLDLQDWCAFAGETFPGLPVIAGGVSMGASTVLMAADNLPDCVCGLLADCGYCSPWDELVHVIHHFIHLPAAPLLRGIDLWCRLLAGFSLRQLSAEDTLAYNLRPVLLYHGEADELVPCRDSERNRDVCAAPVTLLTVPGAGHGLSFLAGHEAYTAAADEFFRSVLSDEVPRTLPHEETL